MTSLKRKDNQAVAIASTLRGSPMRLNEAARMVRFMKIEPALTLLSNSRKKAAVDVSKCIRSAVANAEFNHGLDIDMLFVREAYVGKSLTMKRFHARARGKSSRIIKPFARLTVVLEEGEAPTKEIKPSKEVKKEVADSKNTKKERGESGTKS